MLEFPKCLDDVNVLPRPGNDKLRTLVQAIIEDLQRFQNVAPVLSLVIESLVQNVHDLVESARARCRQRPNPVTDNRTPLLTLRKSSGQFLPCRIPPVPMGHCWLLSSSQRCHLRLSAKVLELHTIAHLDLWGGVALGHIFNRSHDFTHRI